jgi:hypothetical protein
MLPLQNGAGENAQYHSNLKSAFVENGGRSRQYNGHKRHPAQAQPALARLFKAQPLLFLASTMRSTSKDLFVQLEEIALVPPGRSKCTSEFIERQINETLHTQARGSRIHRRCFISLSKSVARGNGAE